MSSLPTSGQKKIPLVEWRRFVQVADWWDRTYGPSSPAANSPDYARDMIVRTPAEGITARTADDVPSALCTICSTTEQATDEIRDLKLTGNEIRVYNIFPWPVPGGIFVSTDVIRGRTRYACYSQGLVAFKLTARVDSLDDFPQSAIAIDADGTQYGEPFDVRTPYVLTGVYGPADIGFRGWASWTSILPDEEEEGEFPTIEGYWQIVHMQRFAEYIAFSGADFTSGGCIVDATADDWWHGEEPTWSVKVDASHLACTCLGDDATGIAVLDEIASVYPYLVYRVVDVDQMLRTADADDCVSNPCATGQATRVLITGDGLTLETLDCGGSAPCAAVIHWAGMRAVTSECEAEGDPGEGTLIHKLVVEAPLAIATSGDCPSVGTISLAGGLITAEGDSCIALTVTESQCTYHLTATFDEECLTKVKVLAGTCISVDEGVDEVGDTTYTVNSTLQIVAGECISVDGDECEKTINNTMSVVGGDGVIVTKNGCAYSVSLDGANADPKTTLQMLCDVDVQISPIAIECVESSGGWGFTVTGGEVTVTKYYTSVTMPSSLIEVTSDCGGSGSSGGGEPSSCTACAECDSEFEKIWNPVSGECDCISHGGSISEGWVYCSDPVFSCADCSPCSEGFAAIMEMATGECDCTEITDPPTYFEGWMYCEDADPVPEGEGIQFNGIDCESYPPHVSFTFLGMPAGATSYVITAVGDQGSNSTIGPSYDHEETPGQEYWGALVDGWGSPQPGEQFVFTVTFSNGQTQTFTGSCP